MANPLLRSAALFTGALVGGAVSSLTLGVALPFDKLLDGLFAQRDAAERAKLRRFAEVMAAELEAVCPSDEGLRTAVCLKLDTTIQRFPLSQRRLAELNLDPARAVTELTAYLEFGTNSERTELEPHCRNLINRYYDKLSRHAQILPEMLPDLWAVVLRRLDDLHELVATLATNDAERRDLQAEVNRLRADGQLLDRAIITLLQDVGERIGDSSAYPDQLRRAGARYRDLLAEAERPRNLPPKFEAVRQQAAALIREGHLDDADSLLLKLRQHMATWRAEQESMLEQAKRDEATILAERAQIARTRLRYREAAALLAEAADLTAFESETSWQHRVAQASALYDLGCEFGDNSALRESIEVYRSALNVAPRAIRPDDWAMTQNNLGNVLATLGERESETASLWQAVEVYEQALLERTSVRAPLYWAITLSNLGDALRTLGEWENSTAVLKRAVAALEQAVPELPRVRVPLEWAAAHNNLGGALVALGERERGTARLNRAIASFRQALLERTPDRMPLDWARTQSNLGEALRMLDERESGKTTLNEAIFAFEQALLKLTRQRVPLDWALTQNNLGNALSTLGERKHCPATLARAVEAFNQALLERTHERMPLGWARTQHNLGNAFLRQGMLESGTASLGRAVEAYEQALLERTRERAPLQWAHTRYGIAHALGTMAHRQADPDGMRSAIAALSDAVEVYLEAEITYRLPTAEKNLARMRARLVEMEGNGER